MRHETITAEIYEPGEDIPWSVMEIRGRATCPELGLRLSLLSMFTAELQMQRGEIEEAFRKMMNGSTNRLVKAFAGAVENALKEDWSFDLKVEVEHAVAERESDD